MGDYADALLKITGIGAVAAAVLFLLFRLVPAWLVLCRSLYPSGRRFTGLRALRPLGASACRVAIGNVFQSDIFYRAARVWIEFHLFRPVPAPRKSNGEGALPADGQAGKPDRERAVPADAQARKSDRERAAWVAKRRQAFQGLAGDKPEALPAISVETLWDIQSERKAEEIGRYLTALDRAHAEPRFLCRVQIGTAFIAPLHLLTGLLTRYEKDWERVIADFTGSTSDDRSDPLRGDLRLLQAFIFDCWLLWGPSIPVCTCQEWHSGESGIALQLGYGDEGNSLPVFGPKELLTRMEQLLKPAGEEGAPGAQEKALPLARQVEITGYLRWGGSHMSDVERGAICNAQREALVPEGDPAKESPPIFLEFGTLEPRGGNRNYYSAYLWVMFVVLEDEVALRESPRPGREARPLFDPKQADYWRGVIPFFEHGNIADRYTLDFLKAQLARKVIGGLANLIDKVPGVRFAYACAFDHSGCGEKLKFSGRLPGHEQGILTALLKELDAPRFEKVKASKRLILDPGGMGLPYSSCRLPRMVADYYRGVNARRG